MPSTSSEVVNSVQVLFRNGTGLGESDGALLDRFSQRGDEAAFAILIERHGPMVLKVCRTILDDDDARDAFQATFLVLIRRLRWIDRNRSVGPWLFGVARRTALRARTDAVRRRTREHQAAEVRSRTDVGPSDSWTELYEELARLPEKYRAPLVLCHLEGCSVEQAAARLECPRGTILSRLSRGREQLKARLTRRGLAPLAALLAADRFASPTATAVPPALADATVKAASQTLTSAATTTAAGLVAVKAALTLATIGGLVAGALALSPPQAAKAPAAQQVASAPEKKAEASNAVAFVSRKIESLALRGHAATIFCAAFSPDGRTLATGDANGTFKFWDVATGREIASAVINPNQTSRRRTLAAIMALDFSPDGKTLAMSCDDQTIRLFDVATLEEKLVLPQTYFPNTLKYSPDGATLAWAVSNPGSAVDPRADKPLYVVVLWDVAAGRERAALAGHTEGIQRIAFSPDGKTIASASGDRTVRLWNAATGEEIVVLRHRSPDIRGLTFSPDGKMLVAAVADPRPGSPSGRPSIWKLDGQPLKWSVGSDGDFAMSVAFSPDGLFLATGGQYDPITIFDAATQHERVVLRGGETFLHGLAFSPDGKTLAATGRAPDGGGGARLWKVGELLQSLTPTDLRPLPAQSF